MPEPVAFLTGRVVSTESSTNITAGTDPTSVAHAKNRSWVLDTAAELNGACLPKNHYRAGLVIDNTNCDAIAVLAYGDDGALDITGDGDHDIEIPAGAMWEMPREAINKGIIAIQLKTNTGTGPCLVYETSYL